MWKITAPDGRIAWFVGDEPDALREMVTELFGDRADRVEVAEVAEVADEAETETATWSAPTSRPPRSGRSPA